MLAPLMCILAVAIAGCATSTSGLDVARKTRGLSADYDPDVLRARLNEYVVDFGASVERTADRIARETDDPEIRRNALMWKLNATLAMRKAGFRLDPIYACIDAWTLAAQMEDFLTTGAGSTLFGPLQPEAVGTSVRLHDEMREIARGIAAEPADADRWEAGAIETWAAGDPITDLAFARESATSRYAELVDRGTGVAGHVANLDERLSILSTQARLYLGDVSKILRWEAELMRRDLLGDAELEDVVESVGRLADEANRATDVAEVMPVLLSDERAVILDEVDRQRALLAEEIGDQLSTVIEAVAAERLDILENIAEQRIHTLDWLGEEREVLVEFVHAEVAGMLDRIESTVGSTIARTDRELEQLADIVVIRLAMLIAAGLVLAPIVARIYVHVWPRRTS
jgi:hypothetical protein